MQHYSLGNFEKNLDIVGEENPLFKSMKKMRRMKQGLPSIFSFVQNKIYYTCYYKGNQTSNFGIKDVLNIG